MSTNNTNNKAKQPPSYEEADDSSSPAFSPQSAGTVNEGRTGSRIDTQLMSEFSTGLATMIHDALQNHEFISRAQREFVNLLQEVRTCEARAERAEDQVRQLQNQLSEVEERFEQHLAESQRTLREWQDSTIVNIERVEQKVIDLLPPGAVVGLANQLSLPETPGEIPGFVYCDSRSLSPEIYSRLFAQIKYRYGRNGTEFKVPDYRGVFLRGHSGDTMHDPGKNERLPHNDTALDPETGRPIAGNQVGTRQNSCFAAHNHGVRTESAGDHTHAVPGYTGIFAYKINAGVEIIKAIHDAGSMPYALLERPIPIGSTSKEGAHTHPVHENNVGGEETRPVNVSIYWYIKT